MPMMAFNPGSVAAAIKMADAADSSIAGCRLAITESLGHQYRENGGFSVGNNDNRRKICWIFFWRLSFRQKAPMRTVPHRKP